MRINRRGSSIALILIAAMLFVQTFSSFEYSYYVHADDFNGVINNGVLTISGSGKITGEAYAERDDITEVIIGSGITSIGNGAFRECKNLAKVTLPDTVTTIAGGAFYGCTQITSFELPPKLEVLGDDALGKTNISEILIPKTLQFTNSEFDQVPALEKIEFEEGIIKVPDTICENSNVKTVILPDGITTIGNYAFSGCINLEVLDVPSSLTTIGWEAFEAVTALTAYCDFHSLAVIPLIEYGLKVCDNGTAWKDSDDLVLDHSTSEYRIDTGGASINGCVPFKVNYKIKNSWESGVSDLVLNIFVPRDTELVEKTLMLNGKVLNDYDYNEETQLLKIPVEESEGTISFGVMINTSNTLYSYASVSMQRKGSDYEEVIGAIGEKFAGITVSCDSQTSNTNIRVAGVAPKSSEVKVSVDNEVVKTVTSKKNGAWSADIELPEPGAFRIYKIKATATREGEEISAEKQVTYREGAPEVTSFEMEYNEHNEIKSVDILNSGDIKPVVYFLPDTEFVFKVKLKNTDKVDTVYINSTRNNVTKQLKAEYDEESDLYVTKGFFDPDDTGYVPGTLTVSYDQKNGGLTSDQLQSDVIDKLAKSAVDDGMTVTNKTVTKEDDGSELISADVDMSKLFGDLAYENIKSEIKIFDSKTGYNASEIFDMYEIGKDMVKVIHTVDGDDLTVGYDFSDPKDIVMVVSKGTGYAEKITDAVYAIRMSDISWKSYDTFQTTYQHAQNWSTGFTLASYALDAANIYIDHNDLVNQIISSPEVPNKSRALREADELAHDQFMFLTMTTVMGVLIAGSAGTMAVPAIAAMALIGSIKILSDVFWQGRTNHVLTGEFKLRMIIDPSGYLYDLDTRERVPDATVSAYWIPDDETEDFFKNKPDDTNYGTLWDASEYEQQNPLKTNSDGKYAWDVPSGWWRVKTEKEGYVTTWSDWVPVPPVQTEVNIGILKNTETIVSGDFEYAVKGGKATITKYTGNAGSVVIPSDLDGSSVVGIGENAFAGCSDIQEITIPETVVSIGDAAFSGCSNLKYVFFKGTSDSWKAFNVTWDTVEPAVHFEAEGHLWNTNYTVDKEATCTEAGSESIHCAVCGVTDESTRKEIPVTAHTYGTLIEEVSPTCTEHGMAAHYKCSECHKLFDAEKKEVSAADLVLAKLGHDLKRVALKKATDKTAGNIEYWKCARCGKLFNKGGKEIKAASTVIPKNNISVTVKKKTFKVKRKKTVLKANKVFAVRKNKGAVTYQKMSGHKKISVARSGKITVKKGLKKGKSYKVKVKVISGETNLYRAYTKTVTVKIKVK